MEEQEMAVKKATVAETMAKVAAKATEAKAEAPKAAPAKTAEKKTEEKKAPAKAAAKATTEKKAATKAPAKAPAKKAAPAKASQNVYIEYAGGQVSTADLIARATAASGKKSVKALNVYYQPETNMVYFTADGDEGSFAY
jgi:hypothetical protein